MLSYRCGQFNVDHYAAVTWLKQTEPELRYKTGRNAHTLLRNTPGQLGKIDNNAERISECEDLVGYDAVYLEHEAGRIRMHSDARLRNHW